MIILYFALIYNIRFLNSFPTKQYANIVLMRNKEREPSYLKIGFSQLNG